VSAARRAATLLAVLGLTACASTACASTVDARHRAEFASPPALGANAGTPSPDAVAASGRGWNARTVNIGVITENDAQKVAEGFGLSDLDPGDQQADARAAAAALNRAGGILGRQVVLKFYNEATFALLASPDTQAAAACTHFTQDQPVAAVVNSVTIIDTPAFRACLATKRVPVFEGSQQPVDTAELDQYGGDVISVLSPSYSDMAPLLVSRLAAEGYFTGWDATNGKPGTAPVKVGVLTPHDPTGAAAAKLLAAALRSAGYPPAAVYSYSATGAGSGTESAAAFQFRAKGITHVIGTGLNTYLFMTPAETAGYRPRYGVSTFNAPGVLLQHNVPKPQLTGALGIGTDPTGDVDATRDPVAVSSAERRCLATMHAAGQSFTGKRVAEAVGLFDCDVFRLLRAAAAAGGGLSPVALARGIALAGPRFVPAETFSSGLRPGRYALAGSARDLAWGTDCECFHYTSTVDHPLTRPH
jgi:hypothetical protein